MSLSKVTYVNNQTVISAENLNAIQDAVIALEKAPSGGGGFSPIATVTQTANGAKISITDKHGTTTAEVSGGKDGFSPVATVTQTNSGATISITDKNGTTTATIRNSEGGGGSGGDSVWTEDNGCFKRLVKTNYGEHYEWLNPPMDLNVLYRTAERYNGKPVYKMVVDLNPAGNVTDSGDGYYGTVDLDWDEDSGEFSSALDSYHAWADTILDYSLVGSHDIEFGSGAITPNHYDWLFYDNGYLTIDGHSVTWSTEIAGSLEYLYIALSFTMTGDEGEMAYEND